MKFDEALRLQNFGEHYSIVLGNISVATRELEQVLKEKEEKSVRVEELKRILNSTEEEILKTKKSLNDARGIIKDSREIEAILAKKKEETDKYIKDNLAELENQKDYLKFDIAGLSQTINELLDDKEVIEKSIFVLLNQSGGLSKTMSELTKEVGEMREVYNELREGIKTLESRHAKEIDRHQDELGIIIKKQEQERDKITLANVYISKKERDIDVMVRRLKSLYAELLPGVTIKI